MSEIANSEMPALSFGAVVGGTAATPRAWRAAVLALTRKLQSLRGDVTSQLRVNVVFHIPGESLPTIEFSGTRTGTYSKRDRLLMVQAAVPSESSEDPEGTLVALAKDAVEAAVDFAQKRSIAEDLPQLRELVDKLTRQTD